MSKLRLCFEKSGTACYISHLDLMRTFQRLFLRSGMFVKHSQGFHPHPIMSIVLPLPVGHSSCCELLDFEIESEVDLEELPECLNAGCPEGLRVLRAYEAEKPVRDLAFVVAEMQLFYDNGVPEGAVEQLKALFSREEVLMEKRTKHKKLTEVNIIPLIRSMTFEENEQGILAHLTVAAQNPGLNPNMVAAAIEQELPDLRPDFVSVHRSDVLDAEGNIFH